MSRLLHVAEREVKKLQKKYDRSTNGRTDLTINLNWGRDGEPCLTHLTTIVNVPTSIVEEVLKTRPEYEEGSIIFYE